MSNREKTKLGYAAKANMMGEKFAWFTEQLEGIEDAITPQRFMELFDLYLSRFDEEMEQIKLKQSISKGRSHQHFSRESSIKMTLEKEQSDYNGGGIQFMDLTDQAQFRMFKEWNGNALSLQHLKLDLISKKFLENKMSMAT